MAGSTGDGEFGFQIAPMLDVLFVLLLFFMVSAGAQRHEASISTELPGGQPGNDIPVNISIDPDGQVNLNGAPTDSPMDPAMPALLGRLKGIVGNNAKQPVIITPSRSTHHQRVVDVLNACSGAGVKNLAFGSPGN